MALQIVEYVDSRAPDTAGVTTGFMIDGRVADLGRVNAACTTVKSACDCPECWQSALGLLTCEACFDAARQFAAWLAAQDDQAHAELSTPLAEVRLLCPVPRPGKVFCLAQNFPSHIGETRTIMPTEQEKKPRSGTTPKVFMKPTPNTICGPGDPILVSPNIRFLDYEAEMVVVIGKQCKYVEPEEAPQYICAVSCLNDVSERDLKIGQRTEVGEWDKFFDWLNGKWLDHFAPMGPALVSTREVDMNDLELRCYVNGELRQQGNTGEMVHNPAETVSYLSQFLTLEAGDIIAMGTPGGVGKARGIKLIPGDEVTVELEHVGRLTNPVVAEPA